MRTLNLFFYFVFQSTLYMEPKKYLDDITEIKNMMDRSSRFLSLSGLSGILAGVYALVGAWFANSIIYAQEKPSKDAYKRIVLTESNMITLFLIAVAIIVLAVATAMLLSYMKAKRTNEKIWNITSKRLLINFMIPLTTGGFFILFLIEKEIYSFTAPLTLVFYGLACVNASKYTLGDLRHLGICLIILGLLSVYFLGFGLLFWALGFGVCHILYGSIMYYKYDRANNT